MNCFFYLSTCIFIALNAYGLRKHFFQECVVFCCLVLAFVCLFCWGYFLICCAFGFLFFGVFLSKGDNFWTIEE